VRVLSRAPGFVGPNPGFHQLGAHPLQHSEPVPRVARKAAHRGKLGQVLAGDFRHIGEPLELAGLRQFSEFL
jgi:hypothetical protein